MKGFLFCIALVLVAEFSDIGLRDAERGNWIGAITFLFLALSNAAVAYKNAPGQAKKEWDGR